MGPSLGYKKKKCLVTGGAGFIGSHLVDALLAEGAQVVVLDDLATGKLSNLSSRRQKFRFVKGDIRDLALVRRLTRKAEIIFHAAARVVAASLDDPRTDMEVNVWGTLAVLLAARDNKALERMVYASSASVYGNPRNIPCHEEDPVSPLSPYAASKLCGENYCKVFFDHYDVPIVALRYFNVFGARQSDKSGYGGVVSIFAKRLLSRKPLEVYGDGTQTRDFTAIQDAVDATMIAGMTERAIGQVFNVGTGTEVSVNDLARMMINVTRTETNIVHVRKRPIDNVRRRVADIEKARYLLKYEPLLPLEEGLRTMVNCLRAETSSSKG